MSGRKVCVTGASGFVAGHVVKELLSRGYNVVGTVRSLKNTEAIGYLRHLPGAAERLTLVEADLTDIGSFDKAFEGCEGLFHIASPFFTDSTKRDEIMKPAREGSLNVYRSAAKAGTIKRVIATSSFATMMLGRDHNVDTRPYTEADQNTVSRPDGDSTIEVYLASKVEAEKIGIEFEATEKPNFNIVTLHPPYVLGPWLPGYDRPNESSIMLKKYATGEISVIPDGGAGFIDVRDLAVAHVLAYEAPVAKGRYLVAGAGLKWSELAEKIKTLFPESKVTSAKAGDSKAPSFDCSKAKRDLGWTPQYSIDDTIKAQGDAFFSK